MSTKIYDFYKFHGKPEDVAPFLNKLRNVLEAKINFRELAEDLHIWQPDTRRTNEHKTDIELMTMDRWDLQELLERIFNSKTSHGPYDVFSASCCVFFHKKRIYIKFFNCRGLDFKEYPELEDFHYQDQCDKPDDVSQRQWNERIKKIDEMTGGSMYSENGLSKKFFDGYELQISRKIEACNHEMIAKLEYILISEGKIEKAYRIKRLEKYKEDLERSGYHDLIKKSNWYEANKLADKLGAKEMAKLERISRYEEYKLKSNKQ